MLKRTPKTEREADAKTKIAPDDPLYCAGCRHLVTRERWAISMNGGHLHTVFNPAGHLFRVRCFEHAPGAAPEGEATDEFTWFPGYFWRIALCRGCGGHLGWNYRGERAPNEFNGLIAPKLTASPG